MFEKKDVQHIATLARIRLTNEEEKRFQKELSSILGYIEQLNEVPTDDVEPLYQTTGVTNALRDDTDEKHFPPSTERTEKLLEQAGDRDGEYVRVRSVLKKK